MAGFTQESLADTLRVERTTVHRWEAGRSRPQPYLWPKLAGLLGLAPAEFRALLGSPARLAGSPDPRQPQAGAVDPGVIDTFVGLRAALVSADSRLGPGTIVQSAAEQVANVSRLLGRADPATRGRLFEVGALYAEFCGWLADDLGHLDDGKAWSLRALEWAHASGSADVTAYVLMRMGQQAQLAADPVRASALGQSALRYEASVRSGRVRASLHQQAAHGAALDGDERAALRHLDTALDLSGAEPGHHDPYRLAAHCTPTYVSVQRAAVLSTLGEHGRALEEYDGVLGGWPSEFHREKGLHLARRTLVAARAGVPDAAVESGHVALGIARETRSRRTMRELTASAACLAAGPAHAGVTEFLEALRNEGETEWMH